MELLKTEKGGALNEIEEVLNISTIKVKGARSQHKLSQVGAMWKGKSHIKN